MITLNAHGLGANEYTEELFGANILASRDQIGADGTFDEKVAALGIDHIRYPGGSLTEDYFDLTDPDKASAIDPDTGREVELLPYSEFMAYAEENDIDVTVVLPTRNYLSAEDDASGHRTAEVDEDALRTFVRDTLNGEYGDPTIRGFEIGNEYWGSGEMDALEYGRVSSRMAEIVNDEINNHPQSELFQDIDILVQNGQNYGSSRLSDSYDHILEGNDQLAAVMSDYGLDLDPDVFMYNNGEVAWPKVMNEIIISEFDTQAEMDAVDGLAFHIYSKGADNVNSRDFDLRSAEQTWDEHFDGLEKHVTEWNLKASRSWEVEEEYGLKQAHEMLNMTEEFTEHGVESGFVWAVQQNNLTNLAGNEGDEGPLNVPGEMFRMMNEVLPNTTAIDLSPADGTEHEVVEEDTAVHSFYSDDTFVTFIASNSEEPHQTQIDFSQILDAGGTMRVEVLGVEDGYNPTDSRSPAEVTELDPADVFKDGVFTADLDAYEIMRVVVDNPNYTEEFERAVAPEPDDPDPEAVGDSVPDPGDPIIPTIPDNNSDLNYPDDTEENQQLADESPDDDGGMAGGLGGLLGLLPLLALLGGF
ncbi:type I secretion protein [Thalassobius sp. Cn5-15]|uniref:type I secretion protein n=1 Tax=Thalassobius sp. Cn5-15 TaxID=2917763 RepID=UPI001EF162B4|nr:type I secretion protein [Thalassobius sp. Cn5-15]MCG7492516.1 type I secretion protein [Thalassobius sp. Cn5-15]